MGNKRFSKNMIAKFIYCFRLSIINKFKIDYKDGTHQLEKHFNKKLIVAINNINLPDNNENWDKIRDAERKIHEVIDSIIAYGKKEMCEIIMQEYDLYDNV